MVRKKKKGTKKRRRAFRRAVKRWIQHPTKYGKHGFVRVTFSPESDVGSLKLRGLPAVKTHCYRLVALLETWNCVCEETSGGVIRYVNRPRPKKCRGRWVHSETYVFPGLYANVLGKAKTQ